GLLDGGGPDSERVAGPPGCGCARATGGKPVPEGGQGLLPIRRVPDPQQRAPGGERSFTIVGSTVGMVDDLAEVRKTGRDPVEVSDSDRGLDAGRVGGGGVRPHAADGLLRRSGWRYEPRRRRFGGQLVEARERLGLVADAEVLHVRYEPLGPEDHEGEELALVAAAPDAFRAEVRRAQESSVGAQGEDVLDAVGDVVGEFEESAERAQVGVASARGRQADGPVVVDELDGWVERRGEAIEADRPDQRRDRPRRCCGAGARGAVGEQLGVALVEPDDGVAQVIWAEDLAPPVSPLRVDVAQYELLPLVGTDIERPAREPARRHPLAPERERVAEGCE